MMADGRFDAMKSLFGFYGDMLPVSKARTKQWFNISGTFFPETKQQTGLYDSGGTYSEQSKCRLNPSGYPCF